MKMALYLKKTSCSLDQQTVPTDLLAFVPVPEQVLLLALKQSMLQTLPVPAAVPSEQLEVWFSLPLATPPLPSKLHQELLTILAQKMILLRHQRNRKQMEQRQVLPLLA